MMTGRSVPLSGLRSSYVVGLVVTLLCVSLISGCGFKLRGARVDAHHLPVVYVHSERGSRLAVELHRLFHQAGITLVEEREQAVWRLTLSDEQRQRRVLSVGRSGKVQEYELYYALNYSVHDRAGGVIIDRQGLSLLRDFSFSGADVLAKADEEELLYQSMQRQAVQIILRRLLSLDQSQGQGYLNVNKDEKKDQDKDAVAIPSTDRPVAVERP